MTKRDKIKKFWSERAVTDNERSAQFDNDQQYELRLKTEFELIEKELELKHNDILVDLGAGTGRFAFLFANIVKKVVAIEYMEKYVDFMMFQKEKLQHKNVEILNMPVEDYCHEDYADAVVISGLLLFLDNEQYIQTIENVSKTLKRGGVLCIREPISLLKDTYIVDKYSKELGTHYYATYRTSRQHVDAFNDFGLRIDKLIPFFEDGHELNKRLETRHFCFIFTKI